MIDLKAKLATAELRQKYQDAGMFTEDDGPDIGDFDAVANLIKDVAAKQGIDPMIMLMGMRFYSENPPSQLTDCEFDDLPEANNYCERMMIYHSTSCVPVSCGFKRWKIKGKS